MSVIQGPLCSAGEASGSAVGWASLLAVEGRRCLRGAGKDVRATIGYPGEVIVSCHQTYLGAITCALRAFGGGREPAEGSLGEATGLLPLKLEESRLHGYSFGQILSQS